MYGAQTRMVAPVMIRYLVPPSRPTLKTAVRDRRGTGCIALQPRTANSIRHRSRTVGAGDKKYRRPHDWPRLRGCRCRHREQPDPSLRQGFILLHAVLHPWLRRPLRHRGRAVTDGVRLAVRDRHPRITCAVASRVRGYWRTAWQRLDLRRLHRVPHLRGMLARRIGLIWRTCAAAPPVLSNRFRPSCARSR